MFANAIKIQNFMFVCGCARVLFNVLQGYALFWIRLLWKRNPTAEFKNITAYVITSIFFFSSFATSFKCVEVISFPRRIPAEFMRQAGIQSGWMEWEAAVGDTKSTSSGGGGCPPGKCLKETARQQNETRWLLICGGARMP